MPNGQGKNASIPRSDSTLCLNASTAVPQFDELTLPKEGNNNDEISQRFNLIKELDKLLNTPAPGVERGSGRIQFDKSKLLLVGGDAANSYSNVLKKTNMFGGKWQVSSFS